MAEISSSTAQQQTTTQLVRTTMRNVFEIGDANNIVKSRRREYQRLKRNMGKRRKKLEREAKTAKLRPETRLHKDDRTFGLLSKNDLERRQSNIGLGSTRLGDKQRTGIKV
ncbi:LOW QUALITY PROTEIN: hypothetical protein PHMEG_00024896 [Phytophthora megakarya]|uniref:Uncharacterized protein n=1 Tax=Phytophthora megakarya TaxID=4795 RepID=A0A225VDB0_9STRA|nr:LOW QUALITY PROTEIN: hypothetical protein PHMEG_00024896 [Phytophthora megakarya]